MAEWRRKYSRLSCHIPVLLRIPGGNPPDGWGTILDISLGGIRVETRCPLTINQEVFVTFVFSENFSFVNTRARVRRLNSQGIYFIAGMEFVALVDQQHLKDALQEYFTGSE